MADAGDGHRRNKSTRSLLGRRKDEDQLAIGAGVGLGLGDGSSLPKRSPSSTSINNNHNNNNNNNNNNQHRHHSQKLSTGTAGLIRSTSHTSIRPTRAMSGHGHTPSIPGVTASIESSVRKFRIFEALRSGDTAGISKAIRESDSTRYSTSSATGSGSGSGSGSLGLEDTTILHLAIQCAELSVVEYVLSDGAGTIDLNARDKEGNTALHLAAAQGRGQIVRLLLDQPGINDSIANYQGRFPLDLARTPDIFQQLQLSRSIFVDSKIRQVQALVSQGDYKRLSEVLEEPRVKMVLDINGGEFASDPTIIQAGGTLLHEAARSKNEELIKVLLFHGADPFRRDRRGKLPQDITKDDHIKSVLRKSPAAVAAQRGIQEKAVLGNVSQQGLASNQPGDALAGKEGREMKGYLKKWTNYRKGYQLRWFVLEDGVMSYYKHQDDSGSACRGAINMKIASLNMDPTEKTKFDIIGKSSVKYNLKANHEVEAKRWFWALNNSIQWTKDQAKEEERQTQRNAELLRQAKADHSGSGSGSGRDASTLEINNSEAFSFTDTRRASTQTTHLMPQSSVGKVGSSNKVSFASGPSVGDDDEGPNYGSYEPSYMGDVPKVPSIVGPNGDDGDDEDEYGEGSSDREAPASKDAFEITAQSAQLQLDMIGQVNAAFQAEQVKNPNLLISDLVATQAVQTFDSSIRNLKGLVGDLLKISKDRDAYWQYRLDREADMRRMWEDSMAQVAREQEILEAKVGESEEKRKMTKRALREAIESGSVVMESRPESRGELLKGEEFADALDKVPVDAAGKAVVRRSTVQDSLRRKSLLIDAGQLSETDSEEEDDEFFDAVDAGEVQAAPMLPLRIASPVQEEKSKDDLVPDGTVDIASSFRGYENGVRTRLKMEVDNRPKVSLWGILKSMIGKDMTKMTLPVSFNEPTSLLQRCAEDMEYADLLDIAADRTEATERMVYVAAFAASEYASTIGRVAKPFNPLLGETFEYVRPDKNYRFFIEQVSHHPPIGAAWAESPRWTYYGESAVKSKFYGKSFDINPLGTWFLKLRTADGKEEMYTWKKVTSSVIGIITGSPTIDNYGPMEIQNWTTGETCLVDFKARGWKASSAYHITGKVNDAKGQTCFSLGGRWNNKIYARYTPGYEATVEEPKNGGSRQRGSVTDPNQVFIVWEANPRPTGIPFNLTPFVVTLNDINDKLQPWLPPTDTRLRPDQRAMEDGEYDFAATEKNRVEEKQRAKRREREQKGEEFEPRWFCKSKCPITGEEFWEFSGKYWKEREKAATGEAWRMVEEIF